MLTRRWRQRVPLVLLLILMSKIDLLRSAVEIVKSVCLCVLHTRLRSPVLPTSPSTRLSSSPRASLGNCRILWQSTLYGPILLSRCNFLFHIHLSPQRLASQLCIRNSCCAALGWKQHRMDARMKWWETCCCQPNRGGTGSGTGIVLAAEGKCCTWKIQCFYLLLWTVFSFLFFLHSPEALKTGNDFRSLQLHSDWFFKGTKQ